MKVEASCLCVALLRGINVGKAKRVPMADLRGLVEELGYTDVRTLLNSGNVIFRATRPKVAKIAGAIEAAFESRFGFHVSVVVVTGEELKAIVAANALHKIANDPARYLVAFIADAGTLSKAKPLLKQSWSPEALAVGNDAAYLWCAGGVNDSKLMAAFSRATGEAATTRNWATVLKLLEAATGKGQNAV